MTQSNFNWQCKYTWERSAKNTLWCLFGCSIGDFGTILYFQFYQINWLTLYIMSLAIINGLITSILLETFILLKKMNIIESFKTAIGMSFISMIVMELTMNIVDLILVGSAKLTWWIIPIMLIAGFLSALPYNYWRLKKYKISCH